MGKEKASNANPVDALNKISLAKAQQEKVESGEAEATSSEAVDAELGNGNAPSSEPAPTEPSNSTGAKTSAQPLLNEEVQDDDIKLNPDFPTLADEATPALELKVGDQITIVDNVFKVTRVPQRINTGTEQAPAWTDVQGSATLISGRSGQPSIRLNPDNKYYIVQGKIPRGNKNLSAIVKGAITSGSVITRDPATPIPKS